MKILIVEDEPRIAKTIQEGLEQEGYAVDVCHDGEEGYDTASADEYDTIILDVMLPGMTGYEISRLLREDGDHTPILLLTAKDQPKDIVTGFDAGADDYLAKPFSFEVLLARIRSLLRRPQVVGSDVLEAQDLKMDTVRHEVTRGETRIDLSQKEYAILEYLLRNKGRVVSKNNIMSHVWDFDADILPNTVEVFIAYLRAKIDKPFASPNLILTVRGVGYRIEN